MIIFIYGTTAEAIKLAPVMRRLRARGIGYEQWLTYQHTASLDESLRTLGLGEPDRVIARGNRGAPLKGTKDVFRWLRSIQIWMRVNIRRLRKTLPANTVVVVHGDTMTSVVGAYIAKRLGVPCAHIEAGLRSGNWRHPFPEELDRRIVGTMAAVHYTPSLESTHHLRAKPNVIHTHGNTAIDAVLDHGQQLQTDEKFGVALLHRYEFISNPQFVGQTIAAVAASTPYPVKLLVDAYSEGAISDAVAASGNGMVIAQPKVDHEEFVELLSSAQFVVTDSGGIQAEAALLGVPTLIHRKTTEQSEGVGENILLSGWDLSVIESFLRDHSRYRRELRRPEKSPSDIIVQDLIERGYAEP